MYTCFLIFKKNVLIPSLTIIALITFVGAFQGLLN